MVKKQKTNVISTFLAKHRKKIIAYNIFIWSVMILLILFSGIGNNNIENVTVEQMQHEVDTRCANNVTLPTNKMFKVRFTDNAFMNSTYCEVITE
jgi:hypothetical protein